MKTIMYGLGRRLKAVRGGLTQEQFGDRLGVDKRTVLMYETGKRQPKAAYLAAVVRETGVSPAWLLLGEGPMRAAGADGGGAHAAIDAAFLKRLIIALEESLIETRRHLAPAEKARAIVLGYEIYRKEGRVDRDAIERIIALAA